MHHKCFFAISSVKAWGRSKTYIGLDRMGNVTAGVIKMSIQPDCSCIFATLKITFKQQIKLLQQTIENLLVFLYQYLGLLLKSQFWAAVFPAWCVQTCMTTEHSYWLFGFILHQLCKDSKWKLIQRPYFIKPDYPFSTKLLALFSDELHQFMG